MTQSKNARELLEEGLSYISMPVALYGGVQITQWVSGAEIEPRSFDSMWFETQVEAGDISEDEIVRDEKNRVKIEAIDPEIAHIAGGSVSCIAVCAVGAVALASLDSSMSLRKGSGGTWSDWGHQIRSNPDVAFASVLLAYAVKDARDQAVAKNPRDYPPDGYNYAVSQVKFFELSLDYWLERYRNVIRLRDETAGVYADIAEDFGTAVEQVGSVITTYNDEQKSWQPVARIFEQAIKTSIEMGF